MTVRVAKTILALFLLAGNARSGIVTKDIQFEKSLFIYTEEGVLLEIQGCRNIGHPGEPILPVYSARFLIPPGEVVSGVTVEAERSISF